MNIFLASISKVLSKKFIVIITGESNSGGYALNSEALSTELLPQPNVKILDNNTLASFQDLDIGTNNLVGHSGLSNGSTHGFELELANRVNTKDLYKKPLYLIKTGQGGSTISQWGVGQSFFTTFTNRVNAGIALVNDASYKKVILLSLGINDAISATNLVTWKANMISHLANMRNVVGANTPIIMTEFQGMGASPTAYDLYSNAINQIAQEIPNTYSINVAGAGLRDQNHWNYSGMKQVSGTLLDILETL